jgi:uncharacterized protein (DUF2147 family)
MLTRILATTALVLFSVVEVSADVPGRLHYNGFLTNAVGEPVDCPDPVQCLTSFDLTFRLYAAIDDTDFQWEETHTNLSFYGGSFHVQLGTVAPITGAILSGPMWLAIKINDNAEMSPRQRIVSAAFAIRAGSADQADNATQLDGMGATDYASATSVADIQTALGTVDTNTQLTEAEVDAYVANNNYSIGDHTLDTNTQLTEADIDAFVANNNYAIGDHTVDTDTQLTEAEVDAFVANNNYAIGDHTVDTDTQLTEAEVDAFVANNNYAIGDHTVDTDTQLTEAEVDAFVANNNYAIGDHTVDTDTQLTEAEVDAFVANNGFAQNSALLTLGANVNALPPSQWTDETGYIRPNNTAVVSITDTGQVGIGTTNPTQSLEVTGGVKLGNTPLCDSSAAGTIRWTGSAFEGCDGSEWTALGGGGGPPSGTIIASSQDAPPEGYLECNGASVSRSAYPDLFDAIGVTYGSDTSSTFSLPDFRGQFLRGWSHGTGIDPDSSSRTNRGDGTTGDSVGTRQSHDYQSHAHKIGRWVGGFPGYCLCDGGQNNALLDDGGPNEWTVSNGGSETRPRNVNVMWLIKI